MKKLIKLLILLIAVLVITFAIVKSVFNVSASDADLPQNVYAEDSNLITVMNASLFEIFVSPDQTDDYTLVEEVTNLVIRDSIKENINELYDPLGSCETNECNNIIYDENYYLNYIWAELTEDDQLLLNISGGTNKVGGFNTIVHVYFDIDIDYTAFEFTLTLDEVLINNTSISLELIDKIVSNFDKDEIEASITKGTLDLDAYTYTISFSLLP